MTAHLAGRRPACKMSVCVSEREREGGRRRVRERGRASERDAQIVKAAGSQPQNGNQQLNMCSHEFHTHHFITCKMFRDSSE